MNTTAPTLRQTTPTSQDAGLRSGTSENLERRGSNEQPLPNQEWQPTEEAKSKAWEVEFLIFEVAGQRHGLPLSYVREVLQAVTVTALPGAPAYVEGVINVRGSVFPVIDLRAQLGLPPKPMEHTDHFIVASVDDRTVAVRVDRAVELVRLNHGDVGGVNQLGSAPPCVSGVAKLRDGLVLIHDLRACLAPCHSAAVP